MFGLDKLIGAAAGGALVFALGSAYVWLQVIPTTRAETRTIVEAEARQKTEAAIDAVNNDAERARAMRRYCTSLGLQYNFDTGKCRE